MVVNRKRDDADAVVCLLVENAVAVGARFVDQLENLLGIGHGARCQLLWSIALNESKDFSVRHAAHEDHSHRPKVDGPRNTKVENSTDPLGANDLVHGDALIAKLHV